jgi:hypothetical protein
LNVRDDVGGGGGGRHGSSSLLALVLGVTPTPRELGLEVCGSVAAGAAVDGRILWKWRKTK